MPPDQGVGFLGWKLGRLPCTYRNEPFPVTLHVISQHSPAKTFVPNYTCLRKRKNQRLLLEYAARLAPSNATPITMTQSQQVGSKKRYQFIPRVLAFLTRGDEVLLIKRAADRAIFPNQYNGLGGHVERGESVHQAAIREVEEESGLQPSSLWLCAVVTIDTGDADKGILMFVFRGEASGETAGGTLQASAEGTLEWVHPDRIAELDMVEDIPTLLPKVLALEPGDPPLWGR
jgi:8-oxo-dGTP diphosphatase